MIPSRLSQIRRSGNKYSAESPSSGQNFDPGQAFPYPAPPKIFRVTCAPAAPLFRRDYSVTCVVRNTGSVICSIWLWSPSMSSICWSSSLRIC